MSAINLGDLRERVMTRLNETGRTGLRADSLRRFLRGDGFPSLDMDTLENEISTLCDRGWLLAHSSAFDPGTLVYRVSPAGRDYLEANHLT